MILECPWRGRKTGAILWQNNIQGYFLLCQSKSETTMPSFSWKAKAFQWYHFSVNGIIYNLENQIESLSSYKKIRVMEDMSQVYRTVEFNTSHFYIISTFVLHPCARSAIWLKLKHHVSYPNRWVFRLLEK